MRNACIKSYNKFYDVDSRLKSKQKGRNQDINVNEIANNIARKVTIPDENKNNKLKNKNTYNFN